MLDYRHSRKKMLMSVLMMIALTLSLYASKSSVWTFNAAWDSYILTDDPLVLHSYDTVIQNSTFYNDTAFGLTVSGSAKIPLFYTHNGMSSGSRAFRSSFDIDAAVLASARMETPHADFIFSLGLSGLFRFLMFNANTGLQAILMFGPKASISSDIHITDTVSLNIGVDGTWQAFKVNYLKPDDRLYQGNAFSITPSIGLSIHNHSDNWSFGR